MTKQLQSSITLTSANVHFGDAIRAKDGLAAVVQYKPDILLLQEATNPTNELERQLAVWGYTLVSHADVFGLAMAIRTTSKLHIVSGSVRTHELQKMGYVERTLAQRWAGRPHNMTSHGMQAAQFTRDGRLLTVVNTRLTVSLKRLARSRQVAAIGQELEYPYYAGQLIVAGDMNHHPSPRKADRAMYRRARLRAVDFNGEPTRRARGSKQEKYLKYIARLQGRPLEDFDTQLDAVLYRGKGLTPEIVNVVDIKSDHRGIVVEFGVGS